MRGLELNLATRPFRNNTIVWSGYALLLFAAIGFSYWNVSSFRHYKAELVELDARDGNIEQEEQDLSNRHRRVLKGVRDFDIKSISLRTTKANEVIDWRAFSWTRLFNRLEEVLPNNVRMTSVRPIFRDRDRNANSNDPKRSVSVGVEGLARDWDSLFEIQTNLFEHPSFGHVNPRFIEKAGNGEFAFSIEFVYFADESGEAPTDDPGIETAGKANDPGEPETGESETRANEPLRSLPSAEPKADEVTDDWAAQSNTEGQKPTETTREDRQKRRALPQAQPRTEDSDDQGGTR